MENFFIGTLLVVWFIATFIPLNSKRTEEEKKTFAFEWTATTIVLVVYFIFN
jgi:hypothetical protein